MLACSAITIAPLFRSIGAQAQAEATKVCKNSQLSIINSQLSIPPLDTRPSPLNLNYKRLNTNIMGVYEENIVPIKVSNLAEYVSDKKRVSLYEALVYIYSNPMYKEMYNEGAKWWYLSSEALYEEFEKRRKDNATNVSKEVFEFFTYTLEMYAQSKRMSGLEVLALFKEYGVDKYLFEHYDLLHTQGTGYVLDEIGRIIQRRKRR